MFKIRKLIRGIIQATRFASMRGEIESVFHEFIMNTSWSL